MAEGADDNLTADLKTCSSCDASLPSDAIFCSRCGSYQGQPGVDHGTRPVQRTEPVHMVDVPPWPGTPGAHTGLRPCPHCGAAVSDIAMACNACLQPVTPSAPLSGPELQKLSTRLVWFFMAGGVTFLLIFLAVEAANIWVNVQHVHIQ